MDRGSLKIKSKVFGYINKLVAVAICVNALLLGNVQAKDLFAKKTPKKTKVVVIGAGLSGLATGYYLKKQGIPYHLLEITPRAGGRVRTVTYRYPYKEQVYADSGMEEYWESNPAVKVLRELKLPLRVDYAVSSLNIGGKIEKLNGEDTEGYMHRILNKDEYQALEDFKKKVAPIISELHTDKNIRPELLKLKDTSFADWMATQGLPKKVSEWVRISVECEAGTEWNRISAIDGLAEFHIFLGKGEKSYRVIGGNEIFIDRFANAVGYKNISVNKRVIRVQTLKDRVRVFYSDLSDNDSGYVDADYVVSTIPLFRLFEVQFEPALSQKKRQAITSQNWGSYFKVHTFVPSSISHYWKNNGESYLPLLADNELGVVYEGNPDQNGKLKVISLLIFGSEAEALNMMPLDQVRDRVKTAFDKMWPGFSKHIMDMEFFRFHPRAIGAWPVGRSRFDELSQEIRTPENGVYLAGDFTESSHSDGAFLSAARVTRQIKADIQERKSSQRKLAHD
ncbi:MAG: flavin monoamine oxidase family protein [Bacteriovoracia bacterium]